MPQYGRFCAIQAGSTTWQAVDGVGPPIGLRARFEIQYFADQSVNKLKLKITNPLPATAQQFVGSSGQSEGMPLIIDAGYADNHDVIFAGRLVQAIYGRDSPTDTVLTIIGADSDVAHNFAVINKTLAAGSTPQDHINAAVQAMQTQEAGFGVGCLDPSLNLSTPAYPRAVTLYGRASKVFADIARSKGANVSYQGGQLQMLAFGNAIPGAPIVLNTNTGLIGMPTQTNGGILARCLINPAIRINTQVQIAQSLVQGVARPFQEGTGGELDTSLPITSIAADGIYNILGIDFDADTRGNLWYMNLICVAPQNLAGGSNPIPLPDILLPALGGKQPTAPQ